MRVLDISSSESASGLGILKVTDKNSALGSDLLQAYITVPTPAQPLLKHGRGRP